MTARAALIDVVVVALVLTRAAGVYAGDAERGKTIYSSRCAFCHGVTGKGDGAAGALLKPPATNLTAPEYWKTATGDAIKAAIENGKPGTAMVSFKASLNGEQLDDLVAFVLTLKPHH